MNFSEEMTIAEARTVLRDLADDGHRCPLCTQYVKVYKRKIHASMAQAIILMYRHYVATGVEWIEIAAILPHRMVADAAKLRYWGLIVEEPSYRSDGSERTGFWRLTDRGVAFVRGQGIVKKYARLYDGRFLGHEGDMVDIKDCLGKKFDYSELMAGI